jgi:Zn finger protein HypA/HybF involved in hydrogenase expression
MHEVSLVAELVEECELRAAGRQVRLVRVRHASSIPAAALVQAFRMLSAGSGLAAAQLHAEPFDVTLNCAACGFGGILSHDDMVGVSIAICPACGDVSTRPRTAELELLAVETVPQDPAGAPYTADSGAR